MKKYLKKKLVENQVSTNNIKVIKEGKNISKSQVEENQKKSKIRLIFLYIIPLIIAVVLGFVYIPTQKNILLLPFGIMFLITLFGWDGSTRTCTKCKKWNATIGIDSKVTKEFEKSTVNKILELVEKASSKKSRSEKFITKFVFVKLNAPCSPSGEQPGRERYVLSVHQTKRNTRLTNGCIYFDN